MIYTKEEIKLLKARTLKVKASVGLTFEQEVILALIETISPKDQEIEELGNHWKREEDKVNRLTDENAKLQKELDEVKVKTTGWIRKFLNTCENYTNPIIKKCRICGSSDFHDGAIIHKEDSYCFETQQYLNNNTLRSNPNDNTKSN